jgi:hypothetical protein
LGPMQRILLIGALLRIGDQGSEIIEEHNLMSYE